MINRIKKYIYTYLRTNQPVRESRFPHMDNPLKVLVIYESDLLERNDQIKAVRQDLLKQQMDVTTWGYVAKKDIQTLILPQSRILGLTDFNWLGKPKEYVLTDLRAEHYDLLIDLSTQPILALRYLALFADADFKTGIQTDENLYDMMIALPDMPSKQETETGIEISWLYEQMMNYLTMIKSND